MNKRKTLVYLIIFLALGLFLCTFIISKSKDKNLNNTETMQEINDSYRDTASIKEENIKNILDELCRDEKESRAIGTKSNILCANYIKEFFENLKINPLLNDNYYNPIDIDMNTFCNNTEISEINNISSVIKGTDSTKAVFITAHFDHISGLTGAIDNASGISVMLQIANELKEYTDENPLNMDVVFIAFNAEEKGLVGSLDFMRKYNNLYDQYYNINIDCVGYNECLDLAMGNKDELSKELYTEFIDVLDKKDLSYNYNIYASKDGVIQGTSDHQVFRMYKHPALVLGSDNLFNIVHTPEDTLDKVDVTYLNKLADACASFVIDNDGKMFY